MGDDLRAGWINGRAYDVVRRKHLDKMADSYLLKVRFAVDAFVWQVSTRNPHAGSMRI